MALSLGWDAPFSVNSLFLGVQRCCRMTASLKTASQWYATPETQQLQLTLSTCTVHHNPHGIMWIRGFVPFCTRVKKRIYPFPGPGLAHPLSRAIISGCSPATTMMPLRSALGFVCGWWTVWSGGNV